jgi:hypothetical protein
VNLAFMGDPPDIDRVRQELIDMPPTERTAAGRAAAAIDADQNPKAFSVKLLSETRHASRLEISPEEGAHDLGMILDDAQGPVLDLVARWDHAAHPHSLLL